MCLQNTQVASEACVRCVKAIKEAERIAKSAADVLARCGQDGGMPALAKPGMPQFEIRGKAGAAF